MVARGGLRVFADRREDQEGIRRCAADVAGGHWKRCRPGSRVGRIAECLEEDAAVVGVGVGFAVWEVGAPCEARGAGDLEDLHGGAVGMAAQDVRYYLNGLLLLVEGKELRAVATDGHRLATCRRDVLNEAQADHQVILPRKGVLELARLLENDDRPIRLQIGLNNLRAEAEGFIFTSKLVDGRFPDYRRVFPRQSDKILIAERELLKQAFSRAAILSNEKFRGVRLHLTTNLLHITANNPEQEEAEELIDVQYDGPEMEVGFNVSYVLDVLNALKCEQVKWYLTDANSSALVEDASNDDAQYVVMPMRL